MTKVCKTCNKEKELSEFYKNPVNAGGYDCHCKDCTYLENKKYSEIRKKWNKENKERVYKSVRSWQERNKEKISAEIKLNQAVLKGKIKKECCAKCGSATVHAHHPDYSKPLEVIWLCPKHHKQMHGYRSE